MTVRNFFSGMLGKRCGILWSSMKNAETARGTLPEGGDSMVIAMTAFPSIDMVRTGKRIETVRKNRGFSVKDIQEYFGFEYPQAVYKWQHGECLPSVDNLFALARLLRVGMEDLLVTLESEDQEVPPFYRNL